METASLRPLFRRLGVPLSQVALAASGYVSLALCGRSLAPTGFAALSAFYLLTNTLGRGTFAAVELEMTRRVSATRMTAGDVAATCAAGFRGALAMLAVVVLVVGLGGSLVAPALGGPGTVALLAGSSATLAASYLVRGPLAADARYVRYSVTFAVEATTAVVGSGVLALTGVTDVRAWAAVLVAAPAVGALSVVGPVGVARLRSVLRATRHPTVRTGLPALWWSALLFVASQGVWNLGPVIAAARLEGADAAAGFVAMVILLRAPVMVFPAIQALVLPSLVRSDRPRGAISVGPALRSLAVALAVIWVAGAVLLGPRILTLLFGVQQSPATAVTAALSISVALGTAAQFGQATLLARRRHRAVALAWAGGLLLVVTGALLPLRPEVAATAGQLLAAAVVLTALLLVGARKEVVA